jgi:precorrin-3B synthase
MVAQLVSYDPSVPSDVPIHRERVDRCPGALSLHQAADGGLARVRLPGGAVSAAQLRTLAVAADELAGGQLELTARANVQIRGLPPDADEDPGAGPRPGRRWPSRPSQELAARLSAAGLLPSASHERVRNMIASPLSGVDGSGPDLSGLVVALDRGLCARPRLAELPGRFLLAVDDGRGDVARLGADITLLARPGARMAVESLEVATPDAVAVALTLAEAFLDERAAQSSAGWRIAELDGGAAAVVRRARAALAGVAVAEAVPVRLPAAPPRPVGVIAQPDGRDAVVAVAPLGRLSSAQALLLADAAGPRGLRISPWRSIVVPDLQDGPAVAKVLAAAGFGVDDASPWYRLSACTGRPGCAEARADVRSDAGQAAHRWPGRQVHWSGCERRCGRPRDTEVDVVATPDGYQISDRSQPDRD